MLRRNQIGDAEEVLFHNRCRLSDTGPTRIADRVRRLHHRATERGDKPAVEFSFEGGDGADGTPCSGRGWMTLEGETLTGRFFFHRGDDTDIELSRMAQKKAKPRKRK